MPQLTDQQRQAIETAIFAGNKIEAIKLHREATGAGLAEAKEAVEAMEASSRQQHPERFTASRKSGCVGVVAVMGLVLAAAIVAVKVIRMI